MRSIDLSHLATKDDLSRMENALRLSFAERFTQLETDNVLIKWMMGFVLAGIVSLVMKAYVG